ncbi:MAG: undecaprenyl/decaprenyl-phosphate alpha-N-acetylglucosaminyl 1-phosphate transferase [Prevotellaceae bacterium]|jgi:UDP-N-acetylmuramyl pentapeptide phosphotransferase/UDP-N-acetylglucosamine-1-phosphate transferase|nr:undecaprenyl/decaprenyl-phosphate alpha-N-acetylglucosaminyl 1-phosphate transferase [Prevotellaceae bacterium]
MNLLFYSAITALVLTFLLTPLFVKFLIRIQILDKGGRRKIHKGRIPSMGGLIIFMSFLFSILLWKPDMLFDDNRFLLAAIILMAVTGIRDDIAPLPPSLKLLVQVVTASMAVVVLTNVRLVSFYGLFGVHELTTWLSYTLSILFILFVTNAFNLIDGIDGLAGTIALACLVFLSVWFYCIGDIESAIFLICFAGAILGFLYYNWQPASLFMGDTGSLVLGFIIAVFTLKFVSFNGTLPMDSSYKFHAVLSAGLAIVLLPVFDTTRVFLLRILKKQSPFLPDRQHLHHAVVRKVGTHARACRLIVGLYILTAGSILFASWKNWMPDWALLLATFGFLVLVNQYVRYMLSHLR